MVRTLAIVAALVGLCASAGTTCAAQSRAASANSAAGVPAKVQCPGERYVSLTADAEQTIPLKLVATLKCGEDVQILSDPQGYTVKVRTTDGKIGYVTRYEVAVAPLTPPAAPSDAGTSQGAGQGAGQGARQANAAGSSADPARDDTADPSKPRVYVSDSQSWTETGGFGRSSSVAEGNLYGGYDPDLTDIFQDFTTDCPAVVVTQEKAKAGFAVLFDKGASKKGFTGLGGLVKVNKLTVVTRSGETIFSQEARSTDTIVRAACEVIAQQSGGGQRAASVRRGCR